MSDLLPEESALALAVLAGSGVEFYPTRRATLPCGCLILSGWMVEKREPGLGVHACSPEHEAAYERAKARWMDPDVCERFLDVEAHTAMAELLDEEISP